MQGLGGQEFARLEDIIGLEVEEMAKSASPIIFQGETCRQLVFLVRGSLAREHTIMQGKGMTSALLKAPTVLEPHNLYGRNCHYAFSYKLRDDTCLISISKTDVSKHLMQLEIFRLNYLNLLCAQTNRLHERLQREMCPTPQMKLMRMMRQEFEGCSGKASIKVKMTDLADYLGETRLVISNTLNQMQDKGLLELGRERITLPDVQRILQKTAEED